jgi:hypothetical protein
MGTILQFRQTEHFGISTDETRSCMRSPEGRSAEIIIFPGVRIERQEGPESPTTTPASPKRAKPAARRKV